MYNIQKNISWTVDKKYHYKCFKIKGSANIGNKEVIVNAYLYFRRNSFFRILSSNFIERRSLGLFGNKYNHEFYKKFLDAVEFKNNNALRFELHFSSLSKIMEIKLSSLLTHPVEEIRVWAKRELTHDKTKTEPEEYERLYMTSSSSPSGTIYLNSDISSST